MTLSALGPALLSAPAALADASPIVSGSLLVAVPLAMLAGLVSFASPCVLPLVPGYLSYVTGLTGVGLARRAAETPGQESPDSLSASADGSTAATAALGAVARSGRSGSLASPGSAQPGVGRATIASASGGTAPPEPAAADQHGSAGASPQSTISEPRLPRGRIVVGTLLFIGGFSAVFVSYGALFGGLGASLLAQQELLTRILGVVVIVLGLGFLGLLPMLQREARWHARPRRGLWGAPLLGALFGLGWTPCIGPTLAAVQSLAFTEASAARGALLSVAYCLGLGLPFLLVGLAVERGLGALAWSRRHARAIQVTGGVSLILLGVLLVSGLWGAVMIELRTWVTGWTVPL